MLHITRTHPIWRPKAPPEPKKATRPRNKGSADNRYHWEAEAEQLMAFCWEHKDHPWWAHRIDLVYFAYACGLRVSEIARCKGSDCDPRGKVKVPVSKSGPYQALVAPPFMEWYRAFLARKDSGFLFGGRCKRTLQRYWNTVCEKAGVRTLEGTHGSRHTFATWAVASGWLKLEQLSKALGHRSYSTTVDYYLGNTTIEGKLLNGKPPRWWGPAQGVFVEHQTDNVIQFRASGGA